MADDDRERQIDEFVREKLASGEKPPWEATSEDEQAWMVAWVIEQLNADEGREAAEMAEGLDEAQWSAEASFNHVIGEARRGNLEPARDIVRERLGPEFARLINQPRPGVRSFPERDSRDDVMLALACHYVYAIRDLWTEKYEQKNRGRDLKPTALCIAAAICDVDEDDLEYRLKKFPRKQPMKKVPHRRPVKTVPRG